MYITGARISEVLNMKTGNFYIDGLGLHIKISVLKRGKPFIHSLRVAMRTPLIDYLLEHIRNTTRDYGDGHPLWHFSNNKDSNRVLAWRAIKKLNPTIYPHLFRHTRLTRLAERGATAAQLMTWAGWKNIKMAATYVQRSEKLIENLADKID